MSSFSVRCVEAFVMAFPGFFRFHFIWYDLRDVCCSTNLEFISLRSTIKPSTSTKFTSYKYKQQTSKWRKCLKRRREMCYYKQLEKLSAFSIAVELKQFLFQIVNGCLVWFVLHYSRYNLCVWKNLWMNQYINGSFFSDFLDVKNPFVCFISYSREFHSTAIALDPVVIPVKHIRNTNHSFSYQKSIELYLQQLRGHDWYGNQFVFFNE